jgi:hypothetical protein
MEEWPSHNDYPLTHSSVLCLGSRARQQGHRAKEQQRCQNEAAKSN